MNPNDNVISRPAGLSIEVNKVLKNTYILLGMTLVFSGLVAYAQMALGLPRVPLIMMFVGFFGLSMLVNATANSGFGLVSVFLFTGFLGYCMGPTISAYLTFLPNGGQIVATAMGGTGIIFFALSAYVLVTRKNFSFIGGMLMVGIFTIFMLMLANLFLFKLPGLSMAISAVWILLMSGLILYQTSEIIHGGETNYIRATTTLFVSIYNLFSSLLHLLGIFGGDD